MKITRQDKPAFRPITIVLETQDEVDRLVGLLNYDPLLTVSGLHDLYEGLVNRCDDAKMHQHWERVHTLVGGGSEVCERAREIGDGR